MLNKVSVILSALCLVLPFQTLWAVDEFQLLYPDNSVSSRPILELRGRRPVTAQQSPSGETSYFGHSFVALGKELDNGSTVFYGIAGFNPQAGNVVTTMRNILHGPGVVEYRFADLRNDEVFRIRITSEQERTVKFIMANWNDKKYAIAWQNCNNLVYDISKALGLNVDSVNPNLDLPHILIQKLRTTNTATTPLSTAEKETGRTKAAREKTAAEMAGIRKHHAELDALPSANHRIPDDRFIPPTVKGSNEKPSPPQTEEKNKKGPGTIPPPANRLP